MKNAKSIQPGYAVYPGLFVPLLNEAEVKRELKKSSAVSNVIPPSVNLTEGKNSVKLEIAVPGIKREDLTLYMDKNILTVYAVHKDACIADMKKGRLHEFNSNFFHRHITLPLNVDSEFMSAEYKSGILCLHIPITKEVANKRRNQIAVY